MVESKRPLAPTSPGSKRPRTTAAMDAPPSLLPSLLFHDTWSPSLPNLHDAPDGHERLAALLRHAGMKVSLISAPSRAVSIYLHPIPPHVDPSTVALWAALGLHPHQEALEREYTDLYRAKHLALLFAHKLREAMTEVTDGTILPQVESLESLAQSPSAREGDVEKALREVISLAHEVKHALQVDTMQKEYHRLACQNATLANALLQVFLAKTGMTWSDVSLRAWGAPSARITITLWEPQPGARRPLTFNFLPGLLQVLHGGPTALVTTMTDHFWRKIWRFGYYPSSSFKNSVGGQLHAFFLSGLGQHGRMPLAAGFEPAYHCSLYLYGLAGAGKSSFVQKLVPALASTLEAYLDPEMDVRFVKQNLNKSLDELDVELTLRPNNNDLSIMSIIQGRRMTLSQTKPGLVVVGLEEVPPVAQEGIDQTQTLQLLADRFSGLRGTNITAEARARLKQQQRTGISGHASVLTVFTSNYELSKASQEALRPLDMFKNVLPLAVTAVADIERQSFATGLLAQLLHDRFPAADFIADIHELSLGQGDIRTLVRHLRTAAFFLSTALLHQPHPPSKHDVISVWVRQAGAHIELGIGGGDEAVTTATLRFGTHGNLFPVDGRVVDPRTKAVQEVVERKLGPLNGGSMGVKEDLPHILDYYLCEVLTPGVVVTSCPRVAGALMEGLAVVEGMTTIPQVDAGTYKIVKSLYDGPEVRCLRDDIKAHRRIHRDALVTTHILAGTTDAQLRVREILEDTPSMIAFSTYRSALHKKGLFFVTYIPPPCPVTPEVRSRASIILP